MWTRKGATVLALALVALAGALVAKSPAAAVLGLLLLALLTVDLFALRDVALSATRTLERDRGFEHEELRVDLDLANPSSRLVFVEVKDRLPRQIRVAGGNAHAVAALPGSGRLALAYRVASPRKGVYGLGPLTYRVPDPVAPVFLERNAGAPSPLLVFPRAADLGEIHSRSRFPMPSRGARNVRQPGDGSEFFALRNYVPGDPFRAINWKATVRGGDLVVNVRERESYAESTIFLDARAASAWGREDVSPLAQSSRALVAIATLMYDAKDTVRLVMYGARVAEIAPGAPERQMFSILESLARISGDGSLPFQAAVEAALPTLKSQTPVFVLSSLEDDVSVEEGIRLLLAKKAFVTVVTPIPTLPAGDESVRGRIETMKREHLVRRLRGYGIPVLEWAPEDTLETAIRRSA
ncbi:MAG: DUF58 domain-containing protein [Methanobacteriota archaeon]